MSYSSCSCYCLLDRTIQICVSCFRAVKIWCFEYNSLILTTGCSTWHLMAKNSEDLRVRIVALHKDGRGYKKFGNSLELSYSTVARGIQRFCKMDLTRNRPRKGRWKKLSPCAVRQDSEACFKKPTNECCQHCFRGCRSGRSAFQCSDHTPHTATSRFAWASSQKEASSEAGSQKKPANSLLKTTWPRAWITGTMSCGLMRLR